MVPRGRRTTGLCLHEAVQLLEAAQGALQYVAGGSFMQCLQSLHQVPCRGEGKRTLRIRPEADGTHWHPASHVSRTQHGLIMVATPQQPELRTATLNCSRA